MANFSITSFLRKIFHAVFKQERARYNVLIALCFPKSVALRILRCFREKKYPLKYTVTLTAIFKNEALYLAEWIEYHLLCGVEHFYLYDNGSDDESCKVLNPYIQKGLVTLHSYPGVKKQLSAYRDAIKRYKNEAKWMIIVDIDEFIYVHKYDSIKTMLDEYENYDAVQCQWILFGDSNYISRPDGLVIENYIHRSSYEKSWAYKSIIKPAQLIVALNQHEFHMLGKSALLSFDIAQCNHYFCKSYEEYVCKKARRNKGQILTDADGIYKYTVKLFHCHNFNDVYDDSMLQYAEQIKTNLDSKAVLFNNNNVLNTAKNGVSYANK